VGVWWGGSTHAPAFQRVPGFELVALCGPRPERSARAAGQLGISDVWTDWRSFVARDDLDLISVATPEGSHYEIAMAAIEAGKHVISEKPLTTSVDTAAELADAAERAAVVTATVCQQRWEPQRLAAWERARAGLFGPIHLIRISRAHVYAHPSQPPYSAWKYRREDGGGGHLYGVVGADVDFVRAAFGEPVAVCADVRTTVPEVKIDGTTITVTTDDTDAVLLRLADGSLAVLTNCGSAQGGAGEQIEVFGRDATFRSRVEEPVGPMLTLVHRHSAKSTARGRPVPEALWANSPDQPLRPLDLEAEQSSLVADSSDPYEGHIRAFASMLEAWLPAFDGQPSPVATFRDAWMVQRILEAARASSAGAGWVTL
jgi:predicted dehydrogenase